MARKKIGSDTPIETLKHKDKRVNIPTKELRDFVAEYEARPKTVLYPRDPSLDPQLVWKGKDEQDTQDLAVPAVPVYNTDYNGESFFVRHAYFTGPDEPYEKLKRALRAHVDESAWSSLYSTKSRPFPRPKSNKIAIKVINHYGDEVLKVCEI